MFKKLIFIIATLLAFSASAVEIEGNLYFYKAKVASIYDGDTIRADLDLGLGVLKINQPLRLYGINAPEVRGESKILGKASRDYLRSILEGQEIVIETIKDKKGKYGRYLAVIWVKGNGKWCEINEWCSANDQLVKAGHAIYKVY